MYDLFLIPPQLKLGHGTLCRGRLSSMGLNDISIRNILFQQRATNPYTL